MSCKPSFFLAALFVTLFANSAFATVIDFEKTTPLYVQQPVFTSNDFEFNSPFALLWKFDSEAHPYYGTNYSGANNETTFLTFYSGSGALNVRHAGGTAFNLISLDLGLGFFNDSISSATVNLTGNLIGGEVVSQSFEVNKKFQTFNLNLLNLTALNIRASNAQTMYLVADNFNVTAVPEPETYALLLAGIGLVYVTVSRRRKRQLSLK